MRKINQKVRFTQFTKWIPQNMRRVTVSYQDEKSPLNQDEQQICPHAVRQDKTDCKRLK